MTLRPERPEDAPAIRAILERAFERSSEADLVDALRRLTTFDSRLSLVAEEASGIVGHVLLTELPIEGTRVLVLAPLAVDPACQGHGVGAALVRHALATAEELRYPAVLVVGDPAYYARFGFEPAIPHGIRSPYDEAGDSFMVAAPGAAGVPSGSAVFPAPFAAV